MHALIIIAHGSRQENANTEIATLINNIANNITHKITTENKQFDYVSHCFLEFATPNFAEVVTALAEKNVARITVVPYFLASGAHVERDIPNEINKARDMYPDIEIHLTKHIGASSLMEQVIVEGVN